MADEETTTETVEETETTEETNVTEEEVETTSEQETEKVTSDDDWKTKARKHEDAAKAERKRREDLEAKVKEYEDANKSEGEKLADAKATAEKDAAAAKTELARLRVAMRKGLTPEQAEFLRGDTEDEIEANAEKLLASFKPAEEPEEEPDPNRRPTETLRPGAASSSEPEETDPRKLAARLPTDY